MEYVEKSIILGDAVILMFDTNRMKGEDHPYNGHFVVITGFDEENFYYHESGPEEIEENRKVSKDKFYFSSGIGTRYTEMVRVSLRK